MAHDKKNSEETEGNIAATGTDGPVRPPSLTARLASAKSPQPTDAQQPKPPALPTADSGAREAQIAKGNLPPPIPATSSKSGVAPPPLPRGNTPTTAKKKETKQDAGTSNDSLKPSAPVLKSPAQKSGLDPADGASTTPAKEEARKSSSVKKPDSEKASAHPPEKPQSLASRAEKSKTDSADSKTTNPDASKGELGSGPTSALKDLIKELKTPAGHKPSPLSPPSLSLSIEQDAQDKIEPGGAPAAGAPMPELEAPSGPPEEPEANERQHARRHARRRPAGPVRERHAANDDAPSIGGLIYALQQKPSTTPFRYAAIGSTVWAILGATALWLVLSAEAEPLTALLVKPTTFLMATSVVVPILVFWFLALLAWRSEELRLRSSTMAEVAIRLAEPDRLAEQSTASLGQAVRRQVSFMNDAVSRALGRAGELEALVHNEVSALERSYEENERKIRGLIQELSNERSALVSTSNDVHTTLKSLGTQIPGLIDTLSQQQLKLAQIIEGAGENLTLLETSLSQGARQIESSIGNRTEQLQSVLDNYTGAVDGALQARTEQMHTMLSEHTQSLGQALTTSTQSMEKTLGSHGREMRTMLEDHSGRMGKALGDTTGQMQGMLESYTSALAEALANRTEEMQEAFEGYMVTLDTSISNRTDNLQSVFEEYARALDTTLASRAQALDSQLVARTRALDDAFNDRLRLFDETIVRTTAAIDDAVGEKAIALTTALDSHAKNFRDTVTRQTAEIDDTLTNGISAVRRSSENVTRQSLKAIEGLASQSELLKRVSENLLGQINSVTNRFESQGQLIMQAANALESANYKIDTALKQRHTELSGTLDRLSHKADEFSQFIEGYSSTLEDQLSNAENRAKAAAEELRQGTQSHQREAIAYLERFRDETSEESQRALADLRERFSTVSKEVAAQFGSLSNRFEATSDEVRDRAQKAASAIEAEQARIREKLQNIPENARESAEAMRRSLQDQLNALEQLSQITAREARNRDVSEAMRGSGPTPRHAGQIPSDSASLRETYDRESQQKNRVNKERQLSSLSSSLARELHSRPLRPAAASPQQSRPAPAASPQTNANQQPQGARPPQGANPSAAGEGWSLGDLLKRASIDEDGSAGPATEPTAQADTGTPRAASPARGSLPDISVMIDAIDTSTAQEIWDRLRSGQRGILVPSLYPRAARAAFEELSRQYRSDPNLREAVGRFLTDFERTVRSAEKNDPSGRSVENHLLSDMGRAYLFLAHVSGRLDA